MWMWIWMCVGLNCKQEGRKGRGQNTDGGIIHHLGGLSVQLLSVCRIGPDRNSFKSPTEHKSVQYFINLCPERITQVQQKENVAGTAVYCAHSNNTLLINKSKHQQVCARKYLNSRMHNNRRRLRVSQGPLTSTVTFFCSIFMSETKDWGPCLPRVWPQWFFPKALLCSERSRHIRGEFCVWESRFVY